MVKIKNKNFSIRQISESGQCFRFNQIEENRYMLIADGKYLEMEQKGEEITFFCEQEDFDRFWENYFDLSCDYGKWIDSVPESDTYLSQAVGFGSGIRILNQDLWEMIVSFIISQQNHIKRIKRCIENICERYGEEKASRGGIKYFAFPNPAALAEAEEEDLRACNLGYRSRYIKNTARNIFHQEVNLESLKGMEPALAKAELRKLSGVGVKVADCISLFGLHHLDAFPVDTHIKKVLDRHYPQGFPFGHYQGYAGVIQQYMFYYDLMKEKE